jgi:hypothetical protein
MRTARPISHRSANEMRKPFTRASASLLLICGTLGVCSVAQAADPTTTDCFAANESSIALRQAGKLREARAQLALCQTPSCPADVRAVCERRLDAVNAAIPTLIFDVKDDAGNDVADVQATMDGLPLSDRLDGTPISFDPGEHHFVFVAPGRPRVEKTFVLKQAEKNRRERIVLGSGPLPQAVASPSTGPGAAPATTARQPDSSLSSQKTWAIVTGAVGLAGLGVGTAFGLSARSQWQQAQSDCHGGCSPTSPAQSEKIDADNAATLSTIAFGIGAAAFVGATVLWLSAPQGPAARPGSGRLDLVPWIGPAVGGCILKGAF